MAFVDPWGGYKEGVQNIADAAQMKLTADKANREAQNFDLDIAEKRRKIAENQILSQTLRDAQKPVPTEIDNPEYSRAAAMDNPLLQAKIQSTRPPTPDEQYRAQYQGLQNAGLGADTMASTLKDVAQLHTLNPDVMAAQKQVEAKKRLSEGLKTLADYKKNGSAVAPLFKESMVSDMMAFQPGLTKEQASASFDKTMDLLSHDKNSGQVTLSHPVTGEPIGVLASADDGKGGTYHHVLPIKDVGDSYKGRTRPEGRQLVFEESHDNGKTWTEKSRGDKDSGNGGVVVTSTPGVYFDKKSRQYMMNTQTGPVALTSAQTKQLGLEYKEEAPTNDIKNMQQSVPGVLALIKQVRDNLDKVSSGPVASRYNEFMAGKIGAPNEDYTKLRTATNLLYTKLMKMHVGSRGSEYMMGHFKDLLDSGKQSPENLKAAMDEMETYANETAQSSIKNPTPVPRDTASPAASSSPKAGDVVKGYKFLGGDPANKNNWKKAGGA